MKKYIKIFYIVFLGIILFPFGNSFAGDSKGSVTKKAARKVKKKEGWFPKLLLTSTISLGQSSNVPGVDDGISFTLGASLVGSLDFVSGAHKWSSSLLFVNTWAKTPSISAFVKTADQLEFKTIYSYSFENDIQLGLFGGFFLKTQVFPTFIIFAKDTPITQQKGDGTSVNKTLKANEAYHLLDAFNPLMLDQKLGVEATPLNDPFAKLKLKFGVTLQEVWARGSIVQDDPTTPATELKELSDYIQAGAELNIFVNGAINKRLSYSLRALFMLPVVTNAKTELSGFELLISDLSLKFSLKLAKWAALDYLFRAQKIPLLSKNWQVTNNLVLSLTLDIW